MKILICGASGYIGNKMFKYFKKKGYEVDGTYYKNKINSFFEFSLKTNEELEKKIMIKKYDIIIWAIGFKDLLKTEIFQGDIYKINISLLNLFIQKLNKFNLNPKLIYISTKKKYDSVEEGQVYVIRNPAFPSWCKVGMAVDAEDRVNHFQTSSPYRDYELVKFYNVQDRRKAEKKAHKILQDKYENRNEWFVASAVQVISLLDECFGVEQFELF